MAFGKHSEDVIQIKIGIDGKNVHFARIKKTLWDKLGTALTGPTNTDRTKWIKNMSKDEFNIDLNSLADMQQFETFIEMRNYDDKGDWLRDKIRHFLNEN